VATNGRGAARPNAATGGTIGLTGGVVAPTGGMVAATMPVVDDAECVGCRLCEYVCPVEGCISMAEVEVPAAPAPVPVG
jgi:NAD-dependent dihydropyrimidine dehydrogenase PreA subunit